MSVSPKIEMTAPPPSQREEQQGAIANLGQMALGDCSFGSLCEMALDELARCLNVRFVKLLELSADKTNFVLKAGRGWRPGLVGHTTIPSSSGSQAGYSLKTSDTVIVKDIASEDRFEPPSLLIEHGIQCGASVIVGPVSDPWGVLGIHESDRERCSFSTYDVDFVRSVANILWLFLRNQKARRETERERQALRSFADAMPILFAVVDAKGRYEYVNEAYRGYGDPARLIGRRVADVAGEEVYRTAQPHIRKVLSGEATRFETKLTSGSSAGRDVLVTYAPRWGEGDAPDGFYAAIVDITDQKQLQRDIAERTRHYQAIADSIPYGVWTCDAEGRLTYVSESFLNLVGMTFNQAREFGWIRSLLPDEVEDTRSAWEACVRDRGNWEREHRFIGRDGRTYDILAIARPVIDENGDLASYVGLNLDITERKKKEELLQLVTRELDHRVKNLFALVLTITRMASRSAKTVEEFRRALDGRLRALAGAHESIAAKEWQGMSLRHLFESELEPYAGGPAKIDLSGPDVHIAAHAIQPLVLAAHELATNAAKYGTLAFGGGTLRVEWSRTPSGGLTVRWIETGVEGLEPPTSTGFGTRVIEQVLVMQLNAQIDMNFRQGGLQLEIVLPSDVLEASE